MRKTVNLDKVFHVSSDLPVFFKRFYTKRAHNRKRTGTKFVRELKNKCASLRASSPFGNILKTRAYTEAPKARERGSPSRLRRSFAFSRGSPRMTKWNRDLLAG